MSETTVSQGSLATARGISTAKKPRPPILKRPSNTTVQNAGHGALLGSPRRARAILERSKPEEAMAACFLQYCAMCEKQISTPSNSILYCSEACRRKDSKKPLSAANIMSAPAPSAVTPSSPRPILQPRTPTGVTPPTYEPVVRIPTENHGFKSDLDPTEWKPKLARASRPASSRYDSEAFRYLSSFHRALNKTKNSNDHNNDDSKVEFPDLNTIAATVPSTPSLSSTPTTTASSWSMSTSAGYDYVHRPLMPRHNRWYSTSVISGQGIDLVTPHIPPPVDVYAKKDIVAAADQNKGALGTFFGAAE